MQCTGSSTTNFDAGSGYGPGIQHLFKTTFQDGSPGTSALELNIPAFGYSSTVNWATAQTSIESHVRFTGLALYVVFLGGFYCWGLTWTALDWYVNGSIQHSFGAATFAGLTLGNPNVSPRLAPSGVPLIGIPATISAGVVPPPVPVPSSPACPATIIGSLPTGVSGSGSASIKNGWRFQESGSSTWQNPPVDISILGIAGIGCAPGLPGLTSGSDTWAASVSASGSSSTSFSLGAIITCHCPPGETEIQPGIVQTVNATATISESSGSICLVPNLAKTVKRLNSDFAEMVYRAALPSATRNASSSWGDPYTGGSGINSVSDQPFPAAAQILSVVGNPAHPLENPLLLPTLAPYVVAGTSSTYSFQEFIFIQAMQCGSPPAPGPPCYSAVCDFCAGTTVSSLTGADGNGGATYLDSGASLEQYVDFLACPLWSCFVWFPQDSDTSAGSSWPLDGSPAPPSKYWLKARTQWLHNALLPLSEERKTRTDIISEPLMDGPLAGFIVNIFGQQTSWWGISRFSVENLTTLASVTLTSSETAGWSFGSCGGTFGGSAITLTPTGTPPFITATYALGGLGTDPRMIVHLANAFVLNWSGSDITSAEVALVGTDGSICPLATAPGTYPWPVGTSDTDYAGDWAQNYTVGFAASDTGVDTLGNGISASEMASVTGVLAFRLPFGFTAASLKFTFNISGTATVILNYPTFNLPTTAPYLVQTSGFNSAILYANSSGVRFGNWNFYNSGWQDTPILRVFGSKSTTLDYLGWANVLYRGVDSQTNVVSTLGTLYDANEGQTELLASVGTISFLALASGGIAGITDNTWREVPPLCAFPMPSRGANLQPSTGYDTNGYSATQEGRYYPTAGTNPVEVKPPSGAQWTSPVSAPPGWSNSRLAHAVTNLEDATFLIIQNNITYANASPWHGYFSVVEPGTGEKMPWLLGTDEGELHLMYVTASNDLAYRYSALNVPIWDHDIHLTSTGGWSLPRFCRDYRRQINIRALYTNQGGGDPLASGIYALWCDDEGQSIGPLSGGALAPELVSTTGRLGDVRSDPHGALLEITYVPDSGSSGPGTLWARWKGEGGPNSFTASPYQLVDGSSNPLHTNDNWFTYEWAKDNTGRWWLAFVIDGMSVISTWYSSQQQAQTWTQFS